MPDLLRVFEKCAKGVRAAVENAAFLLDGLCATPDPAAPPAAVVAPSPKQGSDSPPTDCSIPPLPVGGHPTHELLRDAAQHLQYYIREFEQSITAQINGGGFIFKLLDRADVLDPPK